MIVKYYRTICYQFVGSEQKVIKKKCSLTYFFILKICTSGWFLASLSCITIQARDTRALDFAFNLSLAAINVAKAFCRHFNLNFSIADLKLLMHNAMMIERFLSMFGNLPNVHKNQGLKAHYFKDLLLYGLKASA